MLDTKVIEAMAPLDSFVLDVYIDIAPRYKAWVQDIGPYLPDCERLENALLPWSEVES